jgi:hypothetical protein
MQRTVYALVILNLLLAGYLGFAWSHRTDASKAAPPAPPSDVPGPTTPSKPAQPLGTQLKTPPAKFTWASLASPDLQRYANNLRRVGCPEQTIKDIMLAEVNRLFTPRERALKARPDDIAPWEKQGTFSRYSSETKLRQLLNEKRSLLKELTGMDVDVSMPTRLAGRDEVKFNAAFSAVPDVKRDQVRAIQENYWAQSDDIKQRTMGYLEPEDRDEFQRIKNERRDALAKVLTPREMQDYEMSTSDLTPKLRSRLNDVNPTDDELRKIFDLNQQLDERYSLSRKNPDPLDQEFTATRASAEKEVEQNIRSVLGDDRYAEYERSRDPAYQAISKAGTEAGLTKDAIVQVYDAQRQMKEASQQIQADPGLTPEQRQQSLNDLRNQAQQKLQQLVGDKAGQLWQRLPDARLAQRNGAIASPVLAPTPIPPTTLPVTAP